MTRTMENYPVHVSARLLSWPPHCACCCDSADTVLHITAERRTGKRIVTTTTRGWSVPYCTQCLCHVERYRFAQRVPRIGVLAAILGSISIAVALQRLDWVALATFLTIVTLSIFAFAKAQARATQEMKHSCACPMESVKYLGWYGTVHELIFLSQSYAGFFSIANASKTVSGVNAMPLAYGSYHPPTHTSPKMSRVGPLGLAVLIGLILAVFANVSNKAHEDSRSIDTTGQLGGGDHISGVAASTGTSIRDLAFRSFIRTTSLGDRSQITAMV